MNLTQGKPIQNEVEGKNHHHKLQQILDAQRDNKRQIVNITTMILIPLLTMMNGVCMYWAC